MGKFITNTKPYRPRLANEDVGEMRLYRIAKPRTRIRPENLMTCGCKMAELVVF